jgi:exonuclease III
MVKHKTKPILVTCIYRPPNSKADFMDALENYFHLLDEQDKELIITGDLNCDLSLSVLQPHYHRLMDIIELFRMKQLIVDPTRSNTESLIDIISTNRPVKVKESGVIEIGISDNSLVHIHV